MKTIELKWIEDVNHNVAEDAYNGLKELIATGVFPNIEVECKDDTLYITGEKEILDKVVMKIQKAYVKYGQIMIKEAHHGVEQKLRIESFDDNVQDIFNHTLNDYETFKENCNGEKPTNYITTLGKFQFKFNKLKEAANRKDKKIIQNYLNEIEELSENYEEPRLKPIKEINEGKLIDSVALMVYSQLVDLGYKHSAQQMILNNIDYINEHSNDNPSELTDNIIKRWKRQVKKREKEWENESTEHVLYNEEINKQLSNPSNWGIIEERLDKDTFNKKLSELVQTYANAEDLDLEAAYDLITGNDEIYEYVDSNMTIEDIMDKISAGEIVLENKKIDESFVLSPSELKKKLQRVASKWASEKGVKFEDAYNELRKKKSVKDMLDFYSVDEIIDDLKKQRKEEDDELEDDI